MEYIASETTLASDSSCEQTLHTIQNDEKQPEEIV